MTASDNATQPVTADQDRRKFAAKASADLAGFFNVCMCILGDRLELFKTLAAHGPLTCAELAAHAGIVERYALEWLRQMTCAQYLSYDPSTERFSLPAGHEPALAGEGGRGFLGGVYQNVQSLEQGLFTKFIRAFREGGGVAYDDYDVNYWEGLERASRTVYDMVAHDYIPALPDVHAALTRGALVGDIGCGRGGALITLAQAFPQSRFAGYDVLDANIVQAEANARAAGVAERVRFVRYDPSGGLTERYDLLLSFDALHHAVDIMRLLRVIRSSLQPGGVYLCSEPGCAETLEGNIGMGGAMLYAGSVMVCVPQVLSEGTEALGAAGLPEPTLRDYCLRAGFGSVRLIPMPRSATNVYEIRP